MQPAGVQGGPAAHAVGDVDVDVSGLADPVEAADALFEQFGIAGEAEEDEVAGELEVAAFAADFGADEDLSAFWIGEPGGVAVALEQAEVFVEEGGFDADFGEEFFLNGGGGFGGAGDEKDFFVDGERPQKAGEPGVG